MRTTAISTFEANARVNGVMESSSRFISQELELEVSEAKSAAAQPQERKFLGFSFPAGSGVKRTISPKTLERFKQRIRLITRRAKGVSIRTTTEEPATCMWGIAAPRCL